MPEGQGQIIVGAGSVSAARTFDASGKVKPSPPYRKALLNAYVEYGWTPWLTLIAAPTAARTRSASINAYSGSDQSGFGARLRLYRVDDLAVAFEALAEPPIGRRSDRATEIALGGPHAVSTTMHLQAAKTFSLFGVPSFVDIEPGLRLRGDGWPTEKRFDVTLGVRPWRPAQILLQSFVSTAPSAGPQIQKTSYAKLQLSLVYDLSRSWSIQVGGMRTVAGRNIERDMGPLAAVWYRF